MKNEECRMKNIFYLHPDGLFFILHSTFFILQSQPLLSLEPHQSQNGGDDRDENGNEETEARCLHTIDKVHAEEGGNESWEHDDHVERGEQTHHLVHVVVDDVGVSVHRRVKDVRVDLSCLACLVHLDVHILNEFRIELIDRQTELELREERLVATDGSGKIRETVLQACEAHQVLVIDLSTEVALCLLDETVHLLQILQIPHGRDGTRGLQHQKSPLHGAADG